MGCQLYRGLFFFFLLSARPGTVWMTYIAFQHPSVIRSTPVTWLHTSDWPTSTQPACPPYSICFCLVYLSPAFLLKLIVYRITHCVMKLHQAIQGELFSRNGIQFVNNHMRHDRMFSIRRGAAPVWETTEEALLGDLELFIFFNIYIFSFPLLDLMLTLLSMMRE